MSSAVTTSSVESLDQNAANSAGAGSAVKRIRHLITPLIVLLVAAIVYGSLYFRESSMPAGVGANLVPAERVLKGEVPYRDFYKIQTPGILLLNAGLFKVWGTSLLTALRGVLVFKLLTLAMVFIVASLVVSWKTALIPTVLTLVWLPPGGPFRPAPIQYEMLFVLIALYLTLRWVDSRRALHVFTAGLAIGIVAVFKQNVGVYLALALLVSIVASWKPRREPAPSSLRESRLNGGVLVAALGGVALPLGGLLVYLVTNRALGAALQVFIRGPAAHIQMKLTGYPLPTYALIVLIAGAAVLNIAAVIGRKLPGFRTSILSAVFCGAAICAALAPRSFIDNSIYWFAPVLFLYAAWVYFRKNSKQQVASPGWSRERARLLVLLLFSIASYLEVFPRSVRGLVIGTLPTAFILLAFVFARYYSFDAPGEDPDSRVDHPRTLSSLKRLRFAVVTIIALVFALRMIAPHYFTVEAGGLSFKADTELKFDRGRGVYLPAARAAEVDSAVGIIRDRVQDGGYFFAHALEATPYYFLADRNSPTGATLWNDAGTNDVERARTMQMLREKDVRLILTSFGALAAERYQPLVDFLQNDFHESTAIGRIVFLERNY